MMKNSHFPTPSHLLRSLLLLILLLSSFAFALAERRERVVDNWRPLHFDVALAFDDQLSTLTRAQTTITVQVIKEPLSVLDLDFGEMPVDAVTIGGENARYEQRAGTLNVTLNRPAKKDERLNITINYHGRPKDGLILMNDKDGKPSATGDNWPDRVHHWIPCLDHPSAKATVRFTVTAPQRTLVVANGKHEGTTNNANTTRTWTYTEGVPIPAYCMVIAVGEFALLEPKQPALTPLSFYVPQSDSKYAVEGFGAAAPSLALFAEMVAPYPYEKLALIVGATRFGGMENSSAIVFSSNLFAPRPSEVVSRRFKVRRGIVEVTAHEIAHQWFGDSVTEATWADLWLSEGFATYYAGLFVERYEGKAAFNEYMERQAREYFGYEREHRTPIHDRETVNLFDLLNGNNYQKGAWVLHMLRGLMGDEKFSQGIRAYYEAHKDKTATTEDLRAALEKSSGMDLGEFFKRWIYASGHPIYDATWSWRQVSARGGVLHIRLRQRQTDEAFLIPLTVEMVTASGTKRELLKPKDKDSTIQIPLDARPTDVRIDPDEVVLKELKLKQVP
jgi:aminopeptidase N